MAWSHFWIKLELWPDPISVSQMRFLTNKPSQKIEKRSGPVYKTVDMNRWSSNPRIKVCTRTITNCFIVKNKVYTSCQPCRFLSPQKSCLDMRDNTTATFPKVWSQHRRSFFLDRIDLNIWEICSHHNYVNGRQFLFQTWNIYGIEGYTQDVLLINKYVALSARRQDYSRRNYYALFK